MAFTAPEQSSKTVRPLFTLLAGGLLLTGCGALVQPLPAPLRFVYQPPNTCPAVQISLGGAPIERLTLSAQRPNTVYFTGVINEASRERTDVFSVQCAGSGRPAMRVNVTTPAFPNTAYAGQTVTLQDSAGQPSGLTLVSVTTP